MTGFEEQQMHENEIELRQLLRIIRKRIGWIIGITLLALIISAVVSFYFLTPIYESSTSIMVNKVYSDNEIISSIQLNDINTNMRLAESYSQIIKSRRVADIVIEDMGLDYTYEQLENMTTVKLVNNTEFINISVTNANPKLARDITNTLASVFQEEVAKIMKVENVNILDPAVIPTNPIKPNKTMNVAIAGVLGIMLSLGLIFLVEFLDNTIKLPEDVKNHLNLNVVGAIPFSELSKDESVISFSDPKSPVSEAYRTLRTNIQFASLDCPIKTMVVTSSIAGEGKSTTIMNLATTIAQTGAKVLLIDTDFRKPRLHKIAGRRNNIGLTNVLINKSDFRESIFESRVKNLEMLFSGVIPPNPSELLASNRMKDFVNEVKEDYDFVLFDTPPRGISNRCSIIVDGSRRYSLGHIRGAGRGGRRQTCG
jgi:capsular exopolysaccharide synthesis family protein